jgi:hypothetical protein
VWEVLLIKYSTTGPGRIPPEHFCKNNCHPELKFLFAETGFRTQNIHVQKKPLG